MPTAFRLPNDHLTRILLQSDVGRDSLLEFLCTDSIYSFKDDFDKDDLSDYWGVAHGEIGSPTDGVTDFHFVDDAINGFIEGDPGEVDDADIRLFSKHALWSPARRCVVQTSFDISSLTSAKFEFGFAHPSVELDSPTLSGVVLVKATPTANELTGTFAVAVFDTDDDTNCDLTTQTAGTVASVAQTGAPTLSVPGPISIMVAMTEGGGVRYWINGVPAGFVQTAPRTVDETFGVLGGEAADHGTGANMHLWFMVQNRASGVAHSTRLDYMQAWQEREIV
ncbi:hypothetical protein LCGC14_0581850 [marine sediment metagenome]|uniref:Uncharacterized protein n=1 Tax=marine sediment metagenome TaxID=412755 RepID=A0A0F9RG88_9ZZZZ